MTTPLAPNTHNEPLAPEESSVLAAVEAERQSLDRRSFLKLASVGLATALTGLLSSNLPAFAWRERANMALTATEATPPSPLPAGQEKIERCQLKVGETITGNRLASRPFSPQPFAERFATVEGISLKQLQQHEGLYKGYIAKHQHITEALQRLSSKEMEGANITYHPYRELLVEQSFALNGVLLHEAYFGNLGGSQRTPSPAFKKMLEKHFGSMEAFKTALLEAGKAMRGWVILGLQVDTKHLSFYGLDAHNQGTPMGVHPLLVLDVYEHAYMIDHGTKRADYLTAFWNTLDWQVVEERLSLALKDLK
ncbi:MAG: superoxide dismutase [Vampirovibrionales bacterium]